MVFVFVWVKIVLLLKKWIFSCSLARPRWDLSANHTLAGRATLHFETEGMFQKSIKFKCELAALKWDEKQTSSEQKSQLSCSTWSSVSLGVVRLYFHESVQVSHKNHKRQHDYQLQSQFNQTWMTSLLPLPWIAQLSELVRQLQSKANSSHCLVRMVKTRLHLLRLVIVQSSLWSTAMRSQRQRPPPPHAPPGFVAPPADVVSEVWVRPAANK